MSTVFRDGDLRRVSRAAVGRVHLTYAWRHRRALRLRAPALFTEMVQCRKLFDRDSRLPALSDKVIAKATVAATLGREWIVPTLWSGTVLPETPLWPRPFVVKSRHGCRQSAFVRGGGEDWARIRRQAARWMTQRYGGWLDEWAYGEIAPGLIVEPFIGAGGVLPIDYKFYVFGGRVEHVQVHVNREHAHRWMVVDRNWRPFAAHCADLPPPPSALAVMIEAAETLGGGFDFVRVDLYQPGAAPLFGEMSFYPGSGLDPFDPPELDAEMGRLWLAARGGRSWVQAGQTPAGLVPEVAMIR